jgi:hypothetical protein
VSMAEFCRGCAARCGRSGRRLVAAATWKRLKPRSRRRMGHWSGHAAHDGRGQDDRPHRERLPANQQETIRIQLSTVLQAVISQLLIPRTTSRDVWRCSRSWSTHRPSPR